MKHLLKLITLRHITSEKTRTLLTLAGIVLGVGLLVSVRLANESILHAFRGTINAVTGKTTLQLTSSDADLDETVLAVVRGEPGVVAVAPVLQTLVVVDTLQEPLLVMGVDPFSEAPFREYSFSLDSNNEKDPLEYLLDPQTLFLTESFAQAHGYSNGSTIRLLMDDQIHQFTVRGLLESEGTAKAMQGNFAMMDIATYQWRLGRVGRLDRIDLITQEGINLQEMIQRLSAKLPQGIVVDRPQRRGEQVERMLAAFQLNLMALSAIALLVALFLMYNTMTMAVVRRRTEIGVLRCLGVSTHAIWGLFIVEAFVLGLIGGLVGVPAGWFLSQWALQAMEQTVTSLYTPVIVKNVVMRPSILIEGLALGCVVALVAGVVSVREATRVVPKEVLHRGSEEASRRLNYVKTSFIGILLLLIALFCSQLPPLSLKPIFGYASALFLLLGFACLVPLTTVLLHNLIHHLPLSWTSTELKLASNSLVSALGRSSMAVTAILTGLAMMGGMMIMIHSFRATVEAWINQTVSADLFVIPSARSVSGLEAKMSEKVLEDL
ncbi:MAG: ABC transporter permease, partial [Nitrospira sp.]|nr:ABC transporter permease [Nitrospira sp.]